MMATNQAGPGRSVQRCADDGRRRWFGTLARLGAGVGLGLGLAWSAPVLAAAAGSATAGGAMRVQFRGRDFLHRWTGDGQHEFTPPDDADLKAWRDMITFNVHAQVGSGEQLAEVANKVLANYQRHGKVLKTRSTPRDARHSAQHLAVAVLGTPSALEAAFARFVLHDGAGLVVVVSHRIHGPAVGPEMSRWLAADGQATEDALMAWQPLPSLASLQRLPKSGR